ncbi:hypothetical protein HRbin22_00001 [Candidatus Thermoflexus japonica]|uniref:Uncharacterized protein n=1 Tax=Candidatus Thermoflexus japonica TaxID=2035417 RepID=A0A2H5Y2V8_9CHLR|nr:hypothetical protein HRbin22_00001 [Candidatus Thermoflexus japonica]
MSAMLDLRGAPLCLPALAVAAAVVHGYYLMGPRAHLNIRRLPMRLLRRWRWEMLLLAGALAACQGGPGGSSPPTPTQPAAPVSPTLAPPTPAAVSTPASGSACPEDPARWSLVPLSGPGGKPVQPPPQRIDPPCVYQGLWRDLATALFADYTRADVPPLADKKVEVPWYWDPGPEITRKVIGIYLSWGGYLFYDREGRKIDEILTIYTALPTGDPDYPVLVYLYRDSPGAAYIVQWGDTPEGPFSGRVTEIWPVRLEGGTVLRRVIPVLYHAGVHRWFLADGKGMLRRMHVVEADGSGLWEVLGVRGTTRSELGRIFGKKDYFPDRVDLKAYPMEKTLTFTP